MRIRGQPSGHEPVWIGLQKSFSELLGMPVRLEFPREWSMFIYSEFQELEGVSFRPSLRYTNEEMETRLRRRHTLLLYVMVGTVMEGVMLCYAEKPLAERVYYLDTVAVREKGRGLGKLMMSALLEWAKLKGYKKLRLDTEEVNENGRHLVSFYERLGFIKTNEDGTGDVTMEKLLE